MEKKKKKTMDNRLLEPLKKALHAIGIELHCVEMDDCPCSFWHLCSKAGNNVLEVEIDKYTNGYTVFDDVCYSTLESVWNSLYARVRTFIVDEKPIENPYLGCRSLEEMMVQCDLLSEGD